MAVSTFAGRKCFITGAASGIGRATARAAAEEGAVLFLTDINGEALEGAVREIEGEGGQVALHAALDIRDLEAVRALGRRIHAAHGPMDVVMNVAGVSIWGAVEALEHRHWQQTIDVNLMGPIHVIETFVPEMVRGGAGGHLVNVSSAAGLLGLPWHAAYSASKFGLRGISEVLRFDLARHDIGVSLVCPGAVDTGLVHTIEVAGIDTSQHEVQRLKSRFLDRAITPEKAAKAILRGVEQNRFLVFTSPDIRAAHWLQRFIPPAYELIMRQLNDKLHRLGSKAKIQAPRVAQTAGFVLVSLLTVLAIACGGSEDVGSEDVATVGAGAGGHVGVGGGATVGSTSVGAGGAGPTVTLDEFTCPGATLGQGLNTIMVGEHSRSFHLEFPDDMSGPIGVVFSYHGYKDTGGDGDAAGWRSAAEVDANADPSFPVVVVTPIAIDFNPPVGLDWQLDKGTAADNVDLALFEAALGCLNEQYAIDPAQIYSYGFSAGSVMSSLLHSAYPHVVSAIACVSGMWFNDPAQVDMIQVISVAPEWPPLHPSDGGAVLVTHGGPNDTTIFNIANLEDMAQAAFPFLEAAERVVLDCGHDDGHTLHPELTTQHVMRFFADHRAGVPSPYLTQEPTGFPASCNLRLP